MVKSLINRVAEPSWLGEKKRSRFKVEEFDVHVKGLKEHLP